MPIRLAAFLPAQRFNTQPPEGGWLSNGIFDILAEEGFNTQPPEGGWDAALPRIAAAVGFNTQPPEGGW